VQRLHCENFKSGWFAKATKKQTCGNAKLNNPINASAAESKLVKNLLD
jgi:hypothetical protein